MLNQILHIIIAILCSDVLICGQILHIIIVIVVVLITIISITIFSNQVTTASSDEDGRSIEPNYQEGYEIGKLQGIDDHSDGREHNDSCPPEKGTILWCIGYEIGYNDGYYDSEISEDR